MNIILVDSTLREGLQAPQENIFVSPEAMVSYAKVQAELNIIDRIELYLPGSHIENQVWHEVVDNLNPSQTQIYVGPINTFDADSRPEISKDRTSTLSTTLIGNDVEAIDKINALIDTAPNAPIRVGIECSGNRTYKGISEQISRLSLIDSVEVISINDSNGIFNEGWINGFFSSLPDNSNSRLGFHLHNGLRSSVKNAISIVSEASRANISSLEFDVTAFGHGERTGILALQDALSVLPCDYARKANIKEYLIKIMSLFTSTDPFQFKNEPDKAVSHYDQNGKIRPEYLIA